MNNEYLNQATTLLKQARPELSATHQLEFKNVFGAVGGYVDGTIFITCGKFGIALRLPAETLGTLFQENDVEQLRYFPKGHIKKEYAVLPKRILDDKPQLEKLVDESVKYASSLKITS